MGTYVIRLARSRTSGIIAQKHTLELDRQMTVLDALFIIQRKHDASLSFRCSCRVGMCGTCAMTINYEPRLACQTRLETLRSHTVTIGPLENLPVIKDLIVSLEPFMQKWKRIRPALHPVKQNCRELAIVPPDSDFGREAQRKRDCITCGACYSACSITGSNAGYLGPAAINKGLLRLLDPRDGAVDDRIDVLNAEDGIWRCHTQYNCVAACPKGINLTDSISRLKRAMLRPKQFHDKLNSGTADKEI
jgi:succinate dehydrogenase / fumarate reductase, iron-sulfur subunit